MNVTTEVGRLTRRGALACMIAVLLLAGAAWAPQPVSPVGTAFAQVGGTVPGDVLGSSSDTEMWRAVRRGMAGSVSIPDQKAGVLVQSEGDNWRAIRNGPLSVYGSWVLLGIIALIAVFFALRGRIKIDAGPAGRTIERFNAVERFTHWLTAGAFIVLAITGLNLMYGRYVLLPIMGKDAFAAMTLWGKYAHNFISFAFMLGLLLMFVLWVRHNIPNRHDMIWLAKGGGLFVKGVHPPSKKFNAGQKIIFWLTIIGGVTLSISGIALLFPYEFAPWSATFAALNLVGFNLPTDLGPVQEMQLSQLWHGAVSLVLIAIIVAHIYIGSIGMEGAFDAMGTGQVDLNWAREHHNLWVAETLGEPAPSQGHGDD